MFIIYLIFSVVSIVVFAILMVKILRDKISEHTISKIQTVVAIISAISTILFSILSYCSKPSTTNNLNIYNSKTVSSEEDTIKSRETATTDKKSESSETESNNTTTTQNERTESSNDSKSTNQENQTSIDTSPQNTRESNVPKSVPIKTIIMKSSSKCYNISQTEYDPRGKMYTNVIYLDSSSSNGIGFNGKLELYTEKKYSIFSCSLVPQADFSTNNGAGAYIEIYKDNVLSYTSELITYKTNSINVNLDIRNTEYLQIKIINVNANLPYMAYADTLLCDAYVTE